MKVEYSDTNVKFHPYQSNILCMRLIAESNLADGEGKSRVWRRSTLWWKYCKVRHFQPDKYL